MQLVLGSASPRRLELLKQIGVTPLRIAPADCDETPLKNESPRELALRICRLKADTIILNESEILLTADTVVALGARSLPKALTQDEVKSCLEKLSGRAHRVYTGVTLRSVDKTVTRVTQTRLTFKRLSHEEIDCYVRSNEGIGKAGGYAIQGLAAAFITKIAGSYSNVVGLPLFETAQLLTGQGFAPFKEWGK